MSCFEGKEGICGIEILKWLLMWNLFLIIFICVNIGFNKFFGVIVLRIFFVIV